ncbi:MAG: hypothetical protein SPJ37_07080, partial [Sodaliphilus sp.]|nr:hypothetical protein [Sodaliphilus sp.]
HSHTIGLCSHSKRPQPYLHIPPHTTTPKKGKGQTCQTSQTPNNQRIGNMPISAPQIQQSKKLPKYLNIRLKTPIFALS